MSFSVQAAQPVEPAQDPFRPSGHTGLLIRTLRQKAAHLAHDDALDMGVGSGAVLATLGALGVRRLVGIDIDIDALAAARRLLRLTELLDRVTLRCGSLWDAAQDDQYDIVAANLPQFAAEGVSDPEHTPYWSSAGQDGRELMDPFLAGLSRHLRPSGAAFITHNVFLGIERSQDILRTAGMAARVVGSTAVLLNPAKAAAMNPAIRDRGEAVGLLRLDGYEFMDVDILEIRHRGAA